MNLDHLISKREQTYAAAQEILARAETDERSLTADELAQHADLLGTIQGIDATLKARDAHLAAEVAASGRAQAARSGQPGQTDDAPVIERAVSPLGTEEYRAAFDRFLRTGERSPELRAHTVATDTAGGYLVPDEWANTIVRKLREFNVMRSPQVGATIQSTASGILHVPVETSTGSAAWTSEGSAYNESEDVFAEVLFDAYKMTRIVKVSEELVNDNQYDLMGYIAQTFAESFADLEEDAFTDGDGSGKPRGFLADTALGTTASATNAITFDHLTNLMHSVKPAYRQRGIWMMHDTTLSYLSQIKTGVASDVRYLWRSDLSDGSPARLMGRPVIINNQMPQIATGQKTVAFGDFSYFWIVDRQGTQFARLNERYAELGLIGFKGSRRTDSELTQSEAVKHLIQS